MLTDLHEILKSFEEVALAQLYLDRFDAGFRERAFDAIPGKETTVAVGRHKFTTTSYAVLDDERFQGWHEQTLQDVHSFAPDETQVASRTAYGHLTAEQFRLLAERSRAARGIPPAENKSKAKGKRKASSGPGDTQPTAPTDQELVAS